jgi:hypothetical protein
VGRSVSYPREAIVCFEDISQFDDTEDLDWFVAGLKARATALFPSFYDCDTWRGREDHVLMRNAYSDFGVSQYNGIAAIWCAERIDRAYHDYCREARCAVAWANQARILPGIR